VALNWPRRPQSIEVGGDSGPVINTENATIGDTKDFAQINKSARELSRSDDEPAGDAGNGSWCAARCEWKRVGGRWAALTSAIFGRWLIHGEHPAERGSRKHEPFVELISEFKVTQFK